MSTQQEFGGLIFGCGYLGNRVADRWTKAGFTVAACTRRESRTEEFEKRGIRAMVADVTEPGTLESALVNLTSRNVLFAIGLDRSQQKSVHDVYVNGLRNVLEHLDDSVERFIYISSTGVYSQTDGERIDETSPTVPTREAGKACLAAEQLLRESRFADRAVILRLAGIYGPGRIPQKQSITDGEPIRTNPNGYLNLIHVDDAADVVVATSTLSAGGGWRSADLPDLILVSDDCPVLRRDYYSEAARLCAAPTPKFATLDDESLRQLRGGTSKRVDNATMKRLPGIRLAYPTYREGLAHSIQASEQDTT